MGILSRFRDIMASRMNDLLDKAKDPEKTMDDFMRSLNSDLGEVRAETASVLVEERRARKEWDACRAEIAKLQRYAEKSLEAGNERDARKFLEAKAPLTEKEARLQASYDAASSAAVKMKQLQDKLMSDIGELEAPRADLKVRMAAAKVQQRLNSMDKAHSSMEEQVNSAYYEAMALAELRAERKDSLDAPQAPNENSMSAKTEDEPAARKETRDEKD
ncbi:PspA/IM30 family protein [Paenibacillus sp. TAB 01]|uniref:PspA/IM30 family protein n=1 Tax=Paenibacillus sp. TAB 01 TaxID=3368988 RepID=UPI0037513413